MGPAGLRNLRQYLLPAGLLALTLQGGCANRIRGEIENQEIKPKSAFYFAQDAVLGTDGLIGVVITDVPNGCETWSSYLASAAAAGAAPDLAAQWSANFPPDFWEITLLLRVASPTTPLTGQQLTGIKWTETLDGPLQAQAFLTHHLIPHDVGYFDGTGDRSTYRTDYLSNGGNLVIKKHEPGASIQGEWPTFTKEAETGTDTGLIEIRFAADFCPTADLLDNAGAAPPTTGGTGS